ncbi:hypothetical protein ACFSYH_12080 [Populibacterium corticicola]|uniref:Uncharacterized protein n=1 Tax=Populibacterium corticicola TaxID=1812826 RepID=A0ABW5XJ67_9MICO
MGQRISSHPVNSYRFDDRDAELPYGGDDDVDIYEKPFSQVTKSSVASVLLAFTVGVGLIAGGAFAFGVVLEWGAKLIAGL